ncbi:MAG: hypothetical protein ABI165_05080, partial [Bryobacteraceae bacterium]
NYGVEAFTAPLIRDCQKNGLRHVEVREQSIETFLVEAEGQGRQWDAVLCLGVLHHFHTGYGDHPEAGQLDAAALRVLYERLGKVTRQALYLCVDTTRIADLDAFLDELCRAGEFLRPKLLGWSCSATGQRRPLWEIRKSHA